jgi:hypothetical protein
MSGRGNKGRGGRPRRGASHDGFVLVLCVWLVVCALWAGTGSRATVLLLIAACVLGTLLQLCIAFARKPC